MAAASAKGKFLSPLAVTGGSECNICPIDGVNPAAGTGFNSLYFSRLWDMLALQPTPHYSQMGRIRVLLGMITKKSG